MGQQKYDQYIAPIMESLERDYRKDPRLQEYLARIYALEASNLYRKQDYNGALTKLQKAEELYSGIKERAIDPTYYYMMKLNRATYFHMRSVENDNDTAELLFLSNYSARVIAEFWQRTVKQSV